MFPLIIYHNNCDDGFASAFVMYLYLSQYFKKALDKTIWYPADYQRKFDVSMCKGRDVTICDFSFPPNIMQEIEKVSNTLTVLDHHKTAKEAFENFIPKKQTTIVEFNMLKSGAMLTWEHCFPDQASPILVKHIQDNDLWRFSLPNTKEFIAALRSYPRDMLTWIEIFKKTEEGEYSQFINEGVAIRRFYEQQVTRQKPFAKPIIIGDHNAKIVNGSYLFASDLCNSLLSTEFPVAAMWSVQEHDSVLVSLRSSSETGNVDVSHIAKTWDGGGHRNAAGFKLALPTFMYYYDTLGNFTEAI